MKFTQIFNDIDTKFIPEVALINTNKITIFPLWGNNVYYIFEF